MTSLEYADEMGCWGSVEYNWQPGRTKNSDQDSDLNDDKEAAREGGQAMGSDGLGLTGGTETSPHKQCPSRPRVGSDAARNTAFSAQPSPGWKVRRWMERAGVSESAESLLTGSTCCPLPHPLLGLEPPRVHTRMENHRGRWMSTPSVRTRAEDDFTPPSTLLNM